MADINHRLAKHSEVTSTSCIEWTAYRNKKGYGVIRVNYQTKLAHRVSYEAHIGPIPEGMQVLHRCDNPPCINPEHFFLGNNDDNVQDSVGKGRRRGAPGQANAACRLTPEQVLKIREDSRIQRVIADEYGVARSLIGAIKNREIWQHLP